MNIFNAFGRQSNIRQYFEASVNKYVLILVVTDNIISLKARK